MSNINTEIYGTPETWDYSFINGGLTTDAANALKIQKAKVPRWDYNPDNAGYWNSQLRSGITEGKITKNVPIDKTVCAVGMGKDCPFAEMGYFRRVIREGEVGDVGLDSIVRVGDGVVNGFLWEMRANSGTYGNYNLLSAGGGQNDEKQLTYRTWSPSSENVVNSANQNGNYYIAPYTYYQLKTFIATIKVNVCNSADIPDAPEDITQVPVATWRSLDEWKNNYSDHKITGLRVEFARANQILDSGGRITYTRPSPPSAYSYSVPCGFGLLDELAFDSEEQYKVYDYALFADGASWNTVIFKPFTDTVWNNSVHRIAFFGMYNVFSTYLRYLSGAVWYQIPYSEEIYDAICHAVATFGFIFVTDSTLTLPSAMNTENICFPVINDEGIAHGDYTRGAENLTNDLYNAVSTRDKNYNPTVPVDDNTYSNTTGFNSISAGASATERYVLDAGNTRQLLSDLWTISHNIAGVDYDNYNYKILDSFLVSNPIDSIISLKRFPFNIPHTFSNTKTPVNLGKNHGSAQGYLTYNAFNSVQFAGINIFPRFGNSFLDYAPYTEYELYVPFCGTVKLNAGDILGHTLNCRLQIDLITGACTAYIMADSLVIETMTGTVSCELALTGIDSATIDANIQNSVLNHVNARTNKEVTMLSPMTVGGLIGTASNPFKTAGSIANAKTETQRAEYELTHIQTAPHTMGSAGGLTGWCQEFNARLMIYYPEGDVITNSIPPKLTNLTNYGHTTGFATIDNTTLSNYSGFTVATNAILNFAATATEKEIIMNLLQSGVYL